MRLHLCFFIVVAAPKAVHASDPGTLGGPSDQLLFDDDQALLPSGLTGSAENQQSSALDNEIWPPSADNSISFTTENIALSPNDFSIASDLFASADCSTSNNFIFSTTGKSRLRRLDRCSTLDDNGSPPMLSIPSGDTFDENLRETILRENPGLYNTLRLSQNNEEENTACIILTIGILPVGVCSSTTINDWIYRASRNFPWNWSNIVTLWDLSNVTPGIVEWNFIFSLDRFDLS